MTTNIIVRTEFLEQCPDAVQAFLDGHLAALKAIEDDPQASAEAANASLKSLTGSSLATDILTAAWTTHPSPPPRPSQGRCARRGTRWRPPAGSARTPASWRTVAIAVVVVAGAAWLVGSSGPIGILPELTDPSRGGLVLVLVLGLTAGISTCMALVGGLVLGISASRAASLAASDVRGPSFPARMRPQVAFNVGRVVGVRRAGAVLGAIGSAVTRLPTRSTVAAD